MRRVTPKKPPAKKKPAAQQPAARRPIPKRADFGAPIDGWVAKQPQPQRAIVDALRELVGKAAPDAVATLKWGNAFFTLDDKMYVGISAHKSHVNLILPGPPGTYADPAGRLEGEGKTGQHLKVRTMSDLPRGDVGGWLRTAAGRIRGKG
jgi:hypothetical protein